MGLIKDRHMRMGQWGIIILGLAHLDFKSTRNERIYNMYRNCILAWFTFFVMTEFIEVPLIIKEKNWSHLIDNLSVTVLYISSGVKFVTLMGIKIKVLVKDVRAVEEVILAGVDKTLIEILEKYRMHNSKLSKLILYFIGMLSITLWYCNPGLHYLDWKYVEDHQTNETYTRILIFGSWFPWDWKTHHYWFAYMYQFISGFYGAMMTVSPDAFLWGFMTFTLMNLEVLKYKINMLPQHAKEIMESNPEMIERTAMRVATIKCILLHQRIIAFVKNLDEAMNFMMLIDFFTRSMQIAATALRILYFGNQRFLLISAIEYMWAMTTQLLLAYWYANEILTESQDVSMTIICSRWYDYDPDIINDLKFMMMRARNPLLLNIGPFYNMSNSVAISVLRAAYSFIALMRTVG